MLLLATRRLRLRIGRSLKPERLHNMGNPLASALQDKDFLAAQPQDQMKYLSSIDKDFAAAKPDEQAQYLNHVLAPSRLAQSAKPTQFEKERPGVAHVDQPGQGFLSHVGSGLKSLAGGILQGVPSFGDVGRIAAQTAYEDANRKEAGRSTAYRIAAPIAGAVVPGLNPGGMEAAADVGDTPGILGEAAVPVAAMGAGKLAGAGAEAVGRAGGPLKAIGSAVYDEKGGIRNPYEVAVRKIIPDPGEAARGAQQIRSAKAAMEKDIAKPGKVSTSPGPYRGPSSVPNTTPTPKIARVGGELSESSEGRPATWDNPTVDKLSRWGDPDAIEQRRLRMLGGEGRAPLNFSTIETNPRSITKFDASGAPMRDDFAATHQPREAAPITATAERPSRIGVRQVGGSEQIRTETDSNGTRWAVQGDYRVSIPKRIPDEGIEEYAKSKLAEQRELHKNIPRGGQ